GEQDRQHHALGEGRVDHTDQHDHHADQGAEDPLAGVGHGSRYRVGGHEEHAEGEAAHYQVPVPGHGEHRVGGGADAVEQQAQTDHAQHHASNDAPGGDLGDQQDQAADGDGQRAGFTERTVNGAD